MSSPVVTVEMDDTLKTIRDIFASTKFHHLLVVEDKKLYGVISDRDVLKALSPRLGTQGELPSDTATLNKRAHQIMTRKPITIGKDDSLFAAIDIFETHLISCIPVVDSEQHPIGILSWRDIFKAIKRTKP